MPICWAGHQPGLAAHFHGRKGSFPSPAGQPFLPPSLPFGLTQSGASPSRPDCSPADLIKTPQTSSSSRSPNTSHTSRGPRPYSCLQPCWPSACSYWVCSLQWHLPAVNKVWGTFSPGCRALLRWPCSWSLLRLSLLSTTSGARKSRNLGAWS